MASINSVVLSDIFADALTFSLSLHRHQARKVRPVPYMAHLMSVAALVLEAGGSEDEAIAALLHDAVEDQGGEPTRRAIYHHYGTAIGILVDACTEPPRQTLSWREHKLAYLQQVQQTPAVERIVLADKLHNLRSLVVNLRAEGDQIWATFSGQQDDYLWFYQALLDGYQHSHSWLVDELRCSLNQLFELS